MRRLRNPKPKPKPTNSASHGLPRLAIHTPGPTSHDAHITLDGQPVPGLQAITLTLNPHEINEATLTIAVDGIDVDTDTILTLLAHTPPETDQ